MAVAVDTNVIVRFLVGDDPRGLEASRRLFETETIVVPSTVLIETEWVLRAHYRFGRERIVAAIEALLSIPDVTAMNETACKTALDWFRAGMDFADAMHLALSAESERLFTFDRDFTSRSTKLRCSPPATLLPVLSSAV